MKKHIVWLGVLGLFSGIISGIPTNSQMLIFLPGFIFGTVTALYFAINKLFKKRVFLSASLWIIVSTVAFLIAYFLTSLSFTLYTVFLFLTGALGTWILMLCFEYVCFSVPSDYKRKIILLGGLLGLSFFLADILEEIPSLHYSTDPLLGFGDQNFMALFIVWQTGIGSAFGWLIDKNIKQ